jgi:hypothetical protein
MKKASFLFGALFLMLLSTRTFAQSKPGVTYFSGKWNVLIKGTPNGDARMIFDLQTRNDSLTGVVRDSTGKEFSKISSVELTDTSATVHFTAQDYEVYLVMNKKDNDNITGNMMGMFDAEGKRIKNPQQN